MAEKIRALVTGASGFVGRYLSRELTEHGYEVCTLNGLGSASRERVDICDSGQVQEVVRNAEPDVVVHLAAQAMVSESWKLPQRTMTVNVTGTANLLEAVRVAVPKARVLLIGSLDQYGLLTAGNAPITEEMPLTPRSPYAVSKCAQEELGKVYADAYGMHICMTRTFVCAGPGQRKGLVLADFASGIAAVEAGLADTLMVGNLDTERDFTHIRDAVRAYRLISEKGEAGEVYNVGSGEVHSIREALEEMLRLARCPVQVVETEKKRRQQDIHGAPCDHSKLTAQTGWEPEIPFRRIIEDELNYWREKIDKEGRTGLCAH